MKFTILKVEGNSMHPTLESGAFVLVWHSKWLFRRNKLFTRGTVIKFLGKRVSLPAGLQIATIPLKVGDVVAVQHQQYGLIIKRVAKISNTMDNVKASDKNKYKNKYSYKNKEKKVSSGKSKLARLQSGCKKQQQTLIQFRLRGDNLNESVTENDIGWVDTNALIGRVILTINSASNQ